MVLRILTISLLIGMTCAATWMGNLPKKPEEHAHKEGCYIEEINDVIPFGEEITPIGKGCYRIECTSRMLYYASCGVVGTSDPKCRITEEDLTKPYPKCCRDIECDVENIENNNIDRTGKTLEDD